MMEINSRQRIEWIDVLKGLLLIFICLSHFGNIPSGIIFFVKPTGNVWVPCFFFLSGMLFSTQKYPRFIDYFKSKTKTLLIPYIFLSVLFVLLDWNLYLHTHTCLSESFISIGMGTGSPKASPLWFVLTLYEVSILCYLINKCKNISIKILFIILSSLCGWACFILNMKLPLNLDVALSATLFYGIGNIFRNTSIYINLNLMINNMIKNVYLYGIILVLFFISFISAYYNPGAVLGQNIIKNYFLFIISSFSGIIAVILLTYVLWNINTMNRLFKILIYTARNALPILASHCYIIIFVSNIVKSINNGVPLYLEFGIKLTTLVVSLYFFLVPFFCNKLYFLMGQKKQSWKHLLTL